MMIFLILLPFGVFSLLMLMTSADMALVRCRRDRPRRHRL